MRRGLEKCPTGIPGLDEVTGGGLPRGRPTLVCGTAGCGKTLLGMEFIVRGATRYGEAGVFISFEEPERDLAKNVRSLGFDLDKLKRERKLALDFVKIERSEIVETGEYDLEGLFVRIGHAIDSVGAKRVVLDTLEALFAGLDDTGVLRSELRRLLNWLRERGVTAVITGERGDGTLTRHGIEEYISDCVILLDHRVNDQLSTRRLRVVKYRGSTHGTNEYPFLITANGISVLPITSLGLGHVASKQFVSSGVPRLDSMLGGKGYYRGSTAVISGSPGTGKSSLAAHFLDAACRRGEKCLCFSYEESESQIIRNMRSIGINLEPHVRRKLLRFHNSRPTLHGLEMHLLAAHEEIEQFKPSVLVFDPITTFINAGGMADVHGMLIRLVDHIKVKGITALMTTLTHAGAPAESTAVEISSLIDTWIMLRDIELNGERNRGLYVMKSRGMAHSNQIREYLITRHGFEILNIYSGPGGTLTGSTRVAQEAKDQVDEESRQQEYDRRQRELAAQRKTISAQIMAIQAQLAIKDQEFRLLTSREASRRRQIDQERETIERTRSADVNSAKPMPHLRRGRGRRTQR